MLSSGIDFFMIFVIFSYWGRIFPSDLTRNVMVDGKSQLNVIFLAFNLSVGFLAWKIVKSVRQFFSHVKYLRVTTNESQKQTIFSFYFFKSYLEALF